MRSAAPAGASCSLPAPEPPLLGDLVASGVATDPTEAIVGAFEGGLFAAFVIATSASLAVAGIALLGTAAVPVIVAAGLIVVGIGGLAVLAFTGDVIPAILYLPTLALGVALLLGG